MEEQKELALDILNELSMGEPVMDSDLIDSTHPKAQESRVRIGWHASLLLVCDIPVVSTIANQLPLYKQYLNEMQSFDLAEGQRMVTWQQVTIGDQLRHQLLQELNFK